MDYAEEQRGTARWVTRGLRPRRCSIGCSSRSPIWQPRVVPISCSTLAAGREARRWRSRAARNHGALRRRRHLGTDAAAARARADREGVAATFICADAQTYPFEPGSFDLIVSRFGVMFFQDSVVAFANLRGAARDGGELRMIVWRDPADNPFMTVAQRASTPVLALPEHQPDAPGQFALANDQRVRGILRDNGWSGVELPVQQIVQ